MENIFIECEGLKIFQINFQMMIEVDYLTAFTCLYFVLFVFNYQSLVFSYNY